MKKILFVLLLVASASATCYAQFPREGGSSLIHIRLEKYATKSTGNDILYYTVRNQTDRPLHVAWLRDGLYVGFCNAFASSSIPIFEKLIPPPPTTELVPGADVRLQLERDDSTCAKETGLISMRGSLVLFDGGFVPQVRHVALSLQAEE